MTTFRCSIMLASVLATASLARADDAVPLVLVNQGRLLDTQDQPVDQAVSMTFGLYTDPDPGHAAQPIWHESYQVQVSKGVYAVVLGDTRPPNETKQPLPASVFTAADRWLGIRIANGAELLPRQRVSSVPYAARAASAAAIDANAVDTAQLKDKAVTLAKLALTGGKFVGLDVDTLDGLDSTAFAPASIETKIDAIKVQTDLLTGAGSIKASTDLIGAIKTSTDTLSEMKTGTDLMAGVKTTTDAIKTSTDTLAAMKTGTDLLSGVKTTTDAIKTSVGDGLGTAVGALGTNVGAIKTSVGDGAAGKLDKLLARMDYSADCKDSWVASAWGSSADSTGYQACLRDGRWHRLGKIPRLSGSLTGLTTAAVYALVNAGAQFAIHTTSVGGGSTWLNAGVGGPGAGTIRFFFPRITAGANLSMNLLHWSEDGTKTTELYLAEDRDFNLSYDPAAPANGWGLHVGWARVNTMPATGGLPVDFEALVRF